MNLNAPEHQPVVARDVAIIHAASEKMFSPPDAESAKKINQRMDETLRIPCPGIKGVQGIDGLRDLRKKIKVRNEGKPGAEHEPLPAYPFFSATPLASESNVCTGIRLNAIQGLRVLDPTAGTPSSSTAAYMELICDYANRWHTALSGIDYRSAGTDPKFFFLPDHRDWHKRLMEKSAEEMAQETRKVLSVRRFWQLRYLFVLVNFVPPGQTEAHVALCAVSPEMKTVDYVCSGGDTGLPNSPRTAGSKCLPRLIRWLAAYLGDTFIHYEWRLRLTAGHKQTRSGGDCAIYTVTNAQCLAFGYGMTASFPTDHQDKIIHRRHRYVQDLLNEGFAEYQSGEENTQYYPVLDKKPEAPEGSEWVEFPKAVMEKLPVKVANKNVCYAGCRNKTLLMKHCKRNERFYPGYDHHNISGAGVTLEEFVVWVEDMDAWRHVKKQPEGKKPLPYPEHPPFHWIDPRDSARKGTLRRPLWRRHAEDGASRSASSSTIQDEPVAQQQSTSLSSKTVRIMEASIIHRREEPASLIMGFVDRTHTGGAPRRPDSCASKVECVNRDTSSV